MINSDGLTLGTSLPESRRQKTLLVSRFGWEYVDMKDCDVLFQNGFFPCNTTFPELAFSLDLLSDASDVILANGSSYKAALDTVILKHFAPPPVDFESRFRQVMQIYLPLSILKECDGYSNQNLKQCDETNPADYALMNRFACLVCFSDRNTAKSIILVREIFNYVTNFLDCRCIFFF